MRRVSKRILSSVLTGAMLLSLISSSALAAEPITEPEESPQSNGMTYEDRDAIESIQATVVDSFYGYKVGSVEITYQPGTDLRDVENGTYTVWDRGFNNPEFGKLKITDTQVDDNVVTLIVDEGTDKVTDRTRETYGTLCTSSNWYIDNEGYVHYDGMEKDSIGKEILPNDINKGLQWRNLDLILTIGDQPVYDGIFSTDGVGNMLPDDMTVWEEPILPDGLDEVVLEMVDVGWEAEGYTQVNNQEGTEGLVPVQVIYPDGYDANRAEPYPTIVYQCGGGVCYWEDNGEYAANNLGCNVVYDVMMTEWHEQMPDAIVMSVNVHSTPIDNSATEIAGVLDYAIANWNVDKDRIIVVGNSQGTLISSDLIRQRPDLVAGFVECNGNLGAMGDATIIDGTLENSSLGSWTEEEVQAMIDNGVSVWMFNGETDGDNPASQQDVIEIVKDLYREAGKSEEWIDLHVRASGLHSWQFKQWGETDHSVTKVVAWKYLDEPYLDIWNDPNKPDLEPGMEYSYDGGEEDYDYTHEGNFDSREYAYTVYPESVAEWAQQVFDTVQEGTPGKGNPTDFDSITELETDWSQAAQLPLTGYYTKDIDVNGETRTVKVYISEEASIRSYFTVVAVPDGVDTYEFLETNGWINLADEKGEGLFILEPGENGWGTAQEESDYVDAAIGFLKSPRNANNITVFSTYGEFYLVGYGAGAAPLELWSAANPIFVISQAYVDGTGMEKGVLDEAGAPLYDGNNTSGYDPGFETDEEFFAVLEECGMTQIARKDVPVPTWFAGGSMSDDVSYWLAANDCSNGAVDGVYYQDINSDAPQTAYANSQLPEDAQHGISQVKVSDSVTDAQSIYAWLSIYTRYDNTFAYSNSLAYRLDYTSARVAAQQDALDGVANDTYGETEVWGLETVEIPDHGTVQVGVIAFNDNNDDGEKDPREYIAYIPDGFEGEKLPVLIVYPGNSQTDSIFLDSTQWWQVAEKEGFVPVMVCETYSSATGVSHMDADLFYESLITMMEETVDGTYADLDFTRIYASGQSAGSMTSQGFVRTNPEFFAAVASTSGIRTPDGVNQPIPAMVIAGQSDLGNLLPDLWGSEDLQDWIQYLFDVNGLTDATIGTAEDKHQFIDNRTKVYTWANDAGIPLVQYGQTLLRAHNCYSGEMPILWDFLEHYSFEENADGSITRYYSPSAFETAGDTVEIGTVEAEEGTDFDSIENLAYDYSQAAQLPLTGYYTKNIDVNGDGNLLNDNRTVKVYIAPEASIRSYFTIVAVPDKVDTEEFLQNQGWIDLANEKGEGLFVLEPGANGWGSAEEESAYVEAAIAFLKSPNNVHGQNVFSTFGEFYVAGYGAGGAALELWAAQNPIFVISQAYMDGTSVGTDALTAVASEPYDGSSSNGDITEVLDETLAQVGISGEMAPKDVPVPTYLVGYTGSEDYWKAANDCMSVETDGVFWQSINSDAYATDYAISRMPAGTSHGLSKVQVSADTTIQAEAIYDWLSDYTRYDNTFAYSNALAERLDYTSARVAAQQDAKDGQVNETLSDGTQIWAQEDIQIAGHGTVQVGVIAFSDNSGDGKNDPREYMLYIPEGFEGQELPILMIYPGNSQTDSIFMDSTLWWQIAEDEGIALAFICETYSSSPSSVSHADSDIFYNSLITLMEEKIDGTYADLDFTRIYGSGQSAGSNATQGFAITNPEFFAAVGSTSAAPSPDEDAAYELIPTMMVTGQMDVSDMGQGFTSEELLGWATYMLEVNGFEPIFDAEHATSVSSVDSRHPELYTWSSEINGEEVPLFQWAQCLLRPHNCYPSDMPILWDFMKHFSFEKNEDGTVTRYYSASAFEQDDAIVIDETAAETDLTVDDIKSIQAFTDDTFYGQGLTKVEITYKDGVDVSGVTASDYILEDRGSLNPDYGQVKIAEVQVNGQVVTLIVDDGPSVTDNNALVYTGEGAGVRERNVFGIYPTGAWYRDAAGNIHYGEGDADKGYLANETNMGYQSRASLELKLRHAGEAEDAAACLADDKGQFAGGKWLETVDDLNGFQDLYDLQIESTGNTQVVTDGSGDDYVRGYYYIPENYDPANGIVFTLQGQGISYWQLTDGTNNAGTGFLYDSATSSWANKGAIVVNIHDRSSAASSYGEYDEVYDFIADDVKVMDYFIEQYNVTGPIVLQGNSRGTVASAAVIKALAGQEYNPNNDSSREPVTLDKEIYDFTIDAYICNNGTFGAGYDDADWEAVAETGMKVWAFDGEQDTNNISSIATYTALTTELYGADWAEENVRLTGYPSEIYFYWGESDHSTTRINGWYFADAAFYGPDLEMVDGEIVYNTKLSDGETYTLEGRGSAASKAGYEYTIYDDSFQAWALSTETAPETDLTVDDIESIQAYTAKTMYGQGVVRVEITYKDGVDVSGVTADTYILEDRGSLNPDFGEVKIAEVQVDGQVVTLIMDDGPSVTENNSLVYTGENSEGPRERNVFGIYPTGAWYRDVNGTIYYGDGSQGYAANTTGMGYQSRESLELKLRHVGEAEDAAACLANEDGSYNADGLWAPTEDDLNGFQDLYDLQIESTGNTQVVTDGSGDDYVRGYYYIPENYDPANGIVFTLQGQGISYWQLTDGTNDAGTAFLYDSATSSWANKGAIVVNIHDRSSVARELGDYWDHYDFVKDDVNVMKYFIDEYNITGPIVLQGNSRGTMASAMVIKALAGQEYNPHNQNAGTTEEETFKLDKSVYDFTIDAYICQNGTFGYQYDEADWAAVAATGLKVWAFDGEQDSNNIDSIATYTQIMTELKSADWAAENVRLTGYPSEIYYYWGESDHSTTRINGWYFADAAFYGPDCYVDEDGKIVYNTKLSDGETYTLEGRGNGASKAGHEYTIYDDLFQVWALNAETTAECGMTQEDIESIQAYTQPNFYGQRLYKVEITFAEGTDMTGADNAANYKIWDRAFQNGAFEEGSDSISEVTVNGTTVTLTFDQGPANNEPFGMLCTASWAIAEEFDENGDSTGYAVYAGRSGKPFNYFTREELDLVLAIGANADMEDGVSLTDGYGHFVEGGVWNETVNDVYDGYQMAYVDAVDPDYYTAFDGEVPVHYQVPASYDAEEGMPLVLYVTGNGTSYWEGFDENGNFQANNLGTNVTYDNATAAWLDLDSVIVGSPDVHSNNNKHAGEEVANAIKWFQENYNITKVILIGNSNGTGICSQAMRDFPELVDVFISNNGWIGDGPNQTILADTWTEEQLQKIAEEGIAIWVIQGETDPLANPIQGLTSYKALIPYYEAAGWSDEWIADNLRISAFKHYKFAEWGVNDHSCVKMSSWYYITEPYLDVYEGQEPLDVGDVYHMEDARAEEVRDFEYVTYAESISEWALNIAGGEDDYDDNHGGGGGGGSSSSSRYTVTVADTSNGSVRVSTTRASAGTRVTITVDPDTGYEVDSVTVTAANGNDVTVTERSSTSYTFNMPSRNVEVEVTFVQTGSQGGSDSNLPFGDVASGDWFYDAVEYAYENGLMTGTSASSFTPNGTLTRAMIVQVLYNMEGTPATGNAAFTDVASGAWYANAVNWAAANGIVSGYGDGTFGPEDNVTREQVATILYAYARAKGYDVSAAADLSGYTDASSVSSYADGAMSWAVGAGLISGIGNNLVAPQGTATRAQFAVMLMNFCENIVE